MKQPADPFEALAGAEAQVSSSAQGIASAAVTALPGILLGWGSMLFWRRRAANARARVVEEVCHKSGACYASLGYCPLGECNRPPEPETVPAEPPVDEGQGDVVEEVTSPEASADETTGNEGEPGVDVDPDEGFPLR
jgi:hypothetical protein